MLKLNLDKNKKYGFAVSGGVDSMVMLELCHKEGLDGVVITIDHSLRKESLEEVCFVSQVGAKYGYKTISKKIDCESYSRNNKTSIELSARLLRYEIFEKIAEEEGLDYILLAHHLDDQVETILMRILRGTGVYGLRGIVDRGIYLHPLLKYPKNDILAYAKANSIEYRQDATNEETVYRRNLLRNSVLPIIEERYPDYRDSFIRLADTAKETEDYFDSVLIPYLDNGDGIVFAKSVLTAHKAVAKRSVRKALYALGVEKDFEEKNYNTLFSLVGKSSGTTVELGQGVVARIEYDNLIVERQTVQEEYEEVFSKDMMIEYQGASYSFDKATTIEKGLTFDLDKVPCGSVVRTRKTGDVFKRYGGGTKTLSNYLTDVKMPKNARKNLLVLASGSEVLMLLGVEISDLIKVDSDTKNMYKVTKRNA